MDNIQQNLKETKNFRFLKNNSPSSLKSSGNLKKMLSNKIEYSSSSIKDNPRNDICRLKSNANEFNFARFDNKINLISRKSMQTMNFDSNLFNSDDEGNRKSLDKHNLKKLLTISPQSIFKKSSMAAMVAAKKSAKNSAQE